MEVLDTTIANVALRYIAGGLGVSEDEASWVVTTYLVSNAIILTASAFLAKTIGRKRFFLICLALFTVSSVLCGIAWNLQTLLLFRIMQGLGGGGMVPVATSILVDAFPPAKRGQAFAVFGVAVVVAPVVPVCRHYTVMYRTCGREPWRAYRVYEACSRADRVAHYLRHHGFEVMVAVG